MKSPLQTVSHRTLNTLDLTLNWQAHGVRHTDRTRIAKGNLWRDMAPRGMGDALIGKGPGESVAVAFDGAQLAYFSDPVQERQRFSRVRADWIGANGQSLALRKGRFYPRHVLQRVVNDIFEEDAKPFRFQSMENGTLTGDFRHRTHSGQERPEGIPGADALPAGEAPLPSPPPWAGTRGVGAGGGWGGDPPCHLGNQGGGKALTTHRPPSGPAQCPPQPVGAKPLGSPVVAPDAKIYRMDPPPGEHGAATAVEF